MSSDPREAIALLRYRIVAAATDPRLSPAERGQLVRGASCTCNDCPHGSQYTYSPDTAIQRENRRFMRGAQWARVSASCCAAPGPLLLWAARPSSAWRLRTATV
jgi:hypothetical protein